MNTNLSNILTDQEFGLGNYFVNNYPPYALWDFSEKSATLSKFKKNPISNNGFGIYLHIPFCRKRCKFCYFKVFTDKDKVQRDQYIQSLHSEWNIYKQLNYFRDSKVDHLYFGGGTPSALTIDQLNDLFKPFEKIIESGEVKEVSFECEPGTLTEKKVKTLKELGVTRLSLGVENFSDEVLSENGRAHLSSEVYSSFDWIKDSNFEQVNLDLISGMRGETDENWNFNIDEIIRLGSSSVTIYQMEIPLNSLFAQKIYETNDGDILPSWPTKRTWLKKAHHKLSLHGYVRSSAYTWIKNDANKNFRYRDQLWNDGDLLGLGISSFSYIDGLHFQNKNIWTSYMSAIEKRELPIQRQFRASGNQRLLRSFILNIKKGFIDPAELQKLSEQNSLVGGSEILSKLTDENLIKIEKGNYTLTEDGFSKVDQILPLFFESSIYENWQNALSLNQDKVSRVLKDFFEKINEPNVQFEVLNSSQLKEKENQLLNHLKHMTRVVSDLQKAPVKLQIFENWKEKKGQQRLIRLYGKNMESFLVGYLDINLKALPKEILSQVMEEEKPFGQILEEVNPERRIRILGFFKFEKSENFSRFCDPNRNINGSFYGRIADILLDGEKVARVIEILNPGLNYVGDV